MCPFEGILALPKPTFCTITQEEPRRGSNDKNLKLKESMS